MPKGIAFRAFCFFLVLNQIKDTFIAPNPQTYLNLSYLLSKPTHFKLVDATIYNFFNSNLFEGAWFVKKTHPETFTSNKKFKILLGYLPNEDLSWDKIISIDNLNHFETEISQMIRSKAVDAQLSTKFRHKDGSFLYLKCDIYSNPDDTSEYIFIGFKDVTSEKNDIKALKKEHSQTQAIFDNNGIGTWQYNLITGENYYNDICARLIGYTLEELQNMEGSFWTTLVHPDDLKKIDESINEHIAIKSSSFACEIRVLHKQGHWVRTLNIGSIISYTSDLQPEVIGGIHYAISENNQSELVVRQYKTLLDGINKAAKIGVWEVDLKTNQVSCSDELKNIFELPLTFETTVDNLMDFIKPGNHREKMNQAVKNAVEKGVNYDIEVEIITVNKKRIWTRAIGISEFENGECQRFYGFFQDINEKKTATTQLALKEELFRKTFSNAPVGMAIVDLKGTISRANKNLSVYLGYSEKELLNNNFNHFSHSEDKELTEKHVLTLLKGEREYFRMDKRYIHKDGTVLWGDISVSSVRNESGRLTYFVVQVQDITERKKNELLLSNYKDLLERSNYVAKIGSWEIDVDTHTVQWSESLKSVLETRDHLVPTFSETIEHFVDDSHKAMVHKAIHDALKKGINFDLQIRINTETKHSKWMRMIGISEFKNQRCTRLYGLIQNIDAIKNIEIEVINKEEQWRSTFNHANAGIALLNFDGTASNVNQSLCDIFGYTIREMKELRIKDIALPEDLDHHIKLMTDLIDGNSNNFIKELRFIHKDGHVIWANVSVSSVKNDSNHFTHMVAQVVDITASKTNQILLNKYKNILERSNEVAKIGSWEMDINSHVLLWSKNLGNILGNPDYRPQNIEHSITDYVLEKDRKKIKTLLHNALTTGTDFDLEVQLMTADGPRWMRIIGISEFENGTCKSLHGLVQDIHEFKSAQLEIQLREEELRQTFWHAPIGMSVLDLNGKVIKANPRMCETFGFNQDEMLILDKNIINHPEDQELTQFYMDEILSGKRENFQQEKRYYDRNNNLIWVDLSISAVKNDQDITTHFVCQVNDITDKKLLTESLKEHNNRLQNYAHIVSHNLRSHTGNLSMLLELSDINPIKGCSAELFTHIKSATEDMCATVNHLSEIVEIQNLIKNTFVPINLRKRVKISLAAVQSTLDQVNGEVNIKVNQDEMIYGISSYVDSIILNILTNAIKYRSPHRLLKIEIKAEKIDDYTVLKISDNGLGIDLEQHGTKLFGMYKTFHEHHKARGIGLFMSKNQIEAMDGRIEVDSQLDHGASFSLYFKNENT